MKTNMGALDKKIRILIAVIIGVLYFTNIISGTFAIVLGALAAVFILTSIIGFCPLYVPFGINSKEKP